jgi:hypothetical protein
VSCWSGGVCKRKIVKSCLRRACVVHSADLRGFGIARPEFIDGVIEMITEEVRAAKPGQHYAIALLTHVTEG